MWAPPVILSPSLLPMPHSARYGGRRLSKLLTAMRCPSESLPRFPGRRRRQVDHALFPELATYITFVYASPSSSSPSSVRHERRLKLLALTGPIRELLSIDSKSTSPKATPPP